MSIWVPCDRLDNGNISCLEWPLWWNLTKPRFCERRSIIFRMQRVYQTNASRVDGSTSVSRTLPLACWFGVRPKVLDCPIDIPRHIFLHDWFFEEICWWIIKRQKPVRNHSDGWHENGTQYVLVIAFLSLRIRYLILSGYHWIQWNQCNLHKAFTALTVKP